MFRVTIELCTWHSEKTKTFELDFKGRPEIQLPCDFGEVRGRREEHLEQENVPGKKS